MTENIEGNIKGRVEYTGTFKWIHLDNDCKMLRTKRVIKRTLSAAGSNRQEAKDFAKILAENTREICPECGEDYVYRGKARFLF